MRILIVGAGEVGSSIAASLANTHEVTVVDVDAERVDSLIYGEDVLAIQGDGTDLDVLEEAGVGEADVVIASTNDDETNLAIAGTVDTVGEAFTIARVRETAYVRTWQRSEGRAFGVDFMVSTTLLTAQVIVQVIGIPTARHVEPFSDGTVQMAEIDVPADSPVAGRTIADLDRYDGLTFVGIIREDEELLMPSGSSTLNWGDTVIVIGTVKSVSDFSHSVVAGGAVEDADDVVIVGGSATGDLVASLLEERGFTPRIIEWDPERARELAEAHPESTVLEHDATDTAFLEREHVHEADVVVATLDADARTLLVALLAKQIGVDRVVAVVDERQYVPLFEAVGVDVAVNPREVTAEEISRFTHERRAENVAILRSGAAEVLEFEVEADSVLVDSPLQSAVAELPDGVVIGAITRDGAYVPPRGETVIRIGDHVVMFVRESSVEAVLQLV